MALTKCTVPTDVIGNLGTTTQDRGLTTQQFKDKFDEMPEGIKAYINDTLTVEVDAHMAETATQAALGHVKLPENWIAPTLLSSWVNYGGSYETAGYCRDSFGIVRLRGMIKGGTNTAGTVLFILPSGYRPASIAPFTTGSFSPALLTMIEVYANGEVRLGSAANNGFMSLSGISFRV